MGMGEHQLRGAWNRNARQNGCADLVALKEKFGARLDYWQRGEIMAIKPPSKDDDGEAVDGTIVWNDGTA